MSNAIVYVSELGIYEVCLKRNRTGLIIILLLSKNSKLQHVPFKVVFFSPDALLHSPPQCVHALMDGFFWDCSELHVTAILMAIES